MTDIESFKGGISSALKRAGSAWGMGRYLYSLEATFVDRIVDKATPGAKYGKTRDGKVFYWLPPKLPAWALPKDAATKAKQQQEPKAAKIKDPADSEGPDKAKIVTEKPTEEQLKALFDLAKAKNLPQPHVLELIQSYGVKASRDLTLAQYNQVLQTVQSCKPIQKKNR